jgi:monoamine oxidase
MLDVAIIGAGLSGLSLAAQLHQRGYSLAVFEARDRIGGRILSLPADAGKAASPFGFDLGPSWIWPEAQPYLAEFVRRSGVGVYEQWQQGGSLYMAQRDAPPEPYFDEGAYAGANRVDGGAYHLVEVLLQTLPGHALKLNQRLTGIIDQGDHVALQFSSSAGDSMLEAKRVVMTIPPRLLADAITFQPVLDEDLTALMRQTPTWMAGHAKAVVRYGRPFWRHANLSGNGFAIYPGAALREIFDACSSDHQVAALSGFFGLPAAVRGQHREDLENMVVAQLTHMFGPEAATPEQVLLKDWSDDPFTAAAQDHAPLSHHPQYGHPRLQAAQWNDKLYFGGTETAGQYGGYLEGALESAARVARDLTR